MVFMKKTFHFGWIPLQLPKGFCRVPLHFGTRLGGTPGNVSFDAVPDELIGIQFWRVGRQIKDLKRPIGFFDKLFHPCTFVDWMAIKNEERSPGPSCHQAFQERKKHRPCNSVFNHHESHQAPGRYRRDHIHRKPRACCSNDRRFTANSPGRPSMVIRSDPGFVSKKDFRVLLLGSGFDRRELLFEPSLHGFGILLHCPMQWLLAGDSENFESPTNCLTTHFDEWKFAFQRLSEHFPRPKPKREAQLPGVFLDYPIQPLHVFLFKDMRPSQKRLGPQRLFTTGMEGGKPAINRSSIEAKRPDNDLGTFAFLNALNGDLSDRFKSLVAHFPAINLIHVDSIHYILKSGNTYGLISNIDLLNCWTQNKILNFITGIVNRL